MAQFEYEFSNQDKELVLTQDDSHVFGGTDYIRLTIYPTEAIDNIVTLVGDGGKITKAVFYSSLYNESTTGLEINTSAFQNNLTITPKRIGITSDGSINYNDFKIYTNETGTFSSLFVDNGIRITYHSKYEEATATGNNLQSDLGLDSALHNAVVCYVKARLYENDEDFQFADYFRKMYEVKIKKFRS